MRNEYLRFRCFGLVLVEPEYAEKIVYRRHIVRHVSILIMRTRVRQIVPAASSQRLKAPVALDEFYHGGMVGVIVNDMATLGVLRYDYERNARSIAEEVKRLNEARVYSRKMASAVPSIMC